MNLAKFSRLCIGGLSRQFQTQCHPHLFRATPCLMDNRVKKKKKMDPALLLMRETKKLKKVEKFIRRKESFGRQLKPIDEIVPKASLKRNQESLRRELEPISEDEKEYRALLLKEWGRYKATQFASEIKALQTAMNAQSKALNELRMESEELYQKAIQLQDGDIIYEFTGPVETPPVDNFDSPDGQYTDTTKTYM